ncbi:hypothetical protein PanWU01x14_264400 [Parasponia andersonii]|uniref:Uncharacterized protein n=1 Tax=Parasponia andersonii TaxID=3476 RepID=A0A2P5B7K5_PARAD|nr:hypothetical protein PanWU01x14_264400 [Parasponia andersonii]
MSLPESRKTENLKQKVSTLFPVYIAKTARKSERSSVNIYTHLKKRCSLFSLFSLLLWEHRRTRNGSHSETALACIDDSTKFYRVLLPNSGFTFNAD